MTDEEKQQEFEKLKREFQKDYQDLLDEIRRLKLKIDAVSGISDEDIPF